MPKTESTSNHVEYEGTLDLATVQQILKDLLSSLEQGRVVVEHGEEQVTLEPGQQIKLKLTGGEKEEKQSLELKMSWTRSAEAEEGEPELKISSNNHAVEQKQAPGQSGASTAASGSRTEAYSG